MSPPLILASASPRRRKLLSGLGIDFKVFPSDVPEIAGPGEAPAAFAQRAAREKAADVARRNPGCLVLGADTVVVVDGAIFGKPKDPADARRMLRRLSGATHQVLTAVALLSPSGALEELVVKSEVEFRPLGAAEIEEYLNSGEPFDKAGAYGLQGLARRFVRCVQGSHSNVMGLPMEEVAGLLCRHLQLPPVAPPERA
jgi:septum formation protein